LYGFAPNNDSLKMSVRGAMIEGSQKEKKILIIIIIR
jgi:hypothetical protein